MNLIDNVSVTIFILDPCTGKDCSAHGDCIVDATDTTDGYKCICDVGYTGDDCENGKYFLYIWTLVIFIYLSIMI